MFKKTISKREEERTKKVIWNKLKKRLNRLRKRGMKKVKEQEEEKEDRK